MQSIKKASLGVIALFFLILVVVGAEAKDKPSTTLAPTTSPSTVVAALDGKTLTFGDLQTIKKVIGSPEGEDQALVNMWKINTVLAKKARMENIENDPQAKALIQMGYDQVLVSIYMRLKQSQLAVSDPEVKEYYEKHKKEREFRELDSVTATIIAVEKKPRIEEIKKQLVAGENFDKLAEANRTVTLKTTGLSDILIKDVPAAQLFKKLGISVGYSMAGAPIGEIRGPQSIPNGWILYKVTLRTPGKHIPLEKLASDLKTMLLRRKRTTFNNDLMQAAQKEAGVTLEQSPGRMKPRMMKR